MSWKRYHALLNDGWHTTTLSAAGTHELRLVISNNCCFANIMWIYHVIWRGCCDRLFGDVVSTLSCWSSAIFNNFTDKDDRSLVSCRALIYRTTRQKLHTYKWDMSTLVISNIQNHEQGSCHISKDIRGSLIHFVEKYFLMQYSWYVHHWSLKYRQMLTSSTRSAFCGKAATYCKVVNLHMNTNVMHQNVALISTLGMFGLAKHSIDEQLCCTLTINRVGYSRWVSHLA